MKASKRKEYSSAKHSESIDMDPLSTSIIEELLNSQKQWVNQNQIVKLTFRAMADLMEAHSETIRDLKSIITTRASKQQLSTGLTLKANSSDLARIIQQISSAIDSKVSYADINSILKQYAHKKEVNQLLIHEQRGQHSKRNEDQGELQMKIIQARIDDFQKQISRRLGGCVTLSQFHELVSIVEQKVNISEMNEILESRVSKQYLSTCLQKKVSKSDFETIMSRKADSSDLDYIISSLEMKASLPTIQKLTQIIENKADRSDLMLVSNEKKALIEEQGEKLGTHKIQTDNKISEIRRELQTAKNLLNEGLKLASRDNESMLRNYPTSNQLNLQTNQIRKQIGEQVISLKQKVNNLQRQSSNQLKYDSFKRQLTNQINLRKRCQQKIYEEIDDVRKRVEEISGKGVEKIEFFHFKSEVTEELDQKIETEYVQQAFNKWEIELTQKMADDKQQIYLLIQKMQKALSDSITANSADIMNLTNNYGSVQSNMHMSHKYQYNNFEDVIKKNRREVEQCRKTIDQMYGLFKSKMDVSEYQSDLLELRKKFDVMDREISLRAYIKDVCALADSKPNIEDVNKVFKELKAQVDGKTSEDDLQDVVKDQSIINQTLLCQNIIGRWLWQSGQVKPGGLVPWQVQFANTMPDYYFWQKDKTSILILVGGYYHISVCIFGRGTPLLLINGENIYGKGDENSSMVNNTIRQTKKLGKKKKQKDCLGNKIEEYIILPSRSRISVSVLYEGCEGFLNLKRL